MKQEEKKEKHIKKAVIISIIVLIIVSGVGAISYFKIFKDDISVNQNQVPPKERTYQEVTSNFNPGVSINYDNVDDYLEETSLVKELPEDSMILLRFYNFDSGDREWEKSFVLTKNNVYEGTLENPDLTLALDSVYLKELSSNNFCGVMSKANKNGGLGVSSSLSKAGLLWKFKSLNKYKGCFGLD